MTSTIDPQSELADGNPAARTPRKICQPGWLQRSLSELKHAAVVRAPLPAHLLARNTRLQNSVGILVYHRIAERPPSAPAPPWNVTPRRFRAHMQGLLARGYQPWPLSQVIQHSRQGKPIPPGTFVVTFDDGYANNYHRALPVLQEFKIPATIFLATAYLDSELPFPFDNWPASGSPAVPRESWIPLTTQQCHAMLDGGLIELGAHTHTHADFRGRPHKLREDLARCLDEMDRRFGVTAPAFAFPFGRKDLGFAGGELTEIARQSSVVCGLSTESESIVPGSDPFEWGRYTAASVDTPATLSAKLDGWYAWLRRASARLVRPFNIQSGSRIRKNSERSF